ncbi:MAG: ThiF family adenylyltransferase [Planctomycetes bacterium]|nr:ThiF family adenylyltransferase [Planctomycetota bacterium]
MRSYSKRRAYAGWRLKVTTSQGIEVLDVILDQRFPRSPVRIAFVTRPRDSILPHVEGDGVFCLYPSSASTRFTDPVSIAQNALGEAVRLVEDLRLGVRDNDLRDEFLSYWSLHASDHGLLSLLNPSGRSRIVRVSLVPLPIAAEDDDAIRAWLTNRYSRARPFRAATSDAVLLWLPQAILPHEYPRTSKDILGIADRAEGQGGRLLEAAVSRSDASTLVLLAATTTTGPCLAAITLHRPLNIENGFRAGKVPQGVFTRRFFGEGKVVCGTVTRVDGSWVHGRGSDARLERLAASKVVVLGCGSVGSQVAVALAQAGVGRLVLVDPENLESANIGRHALGAEDLGKNKAEALAHRIRARFPHLRSVEARHSEWDEAIKKEPSLFEPSHLIISAIGNWSSEASLNEWHIAGSRPQPIVYAWTEAHACAGHAVAVCGVGGCLQCGFSELGEPKDPVTKWPEGATTLQEPACGTQFQPYGPVELMHINSMVSELALDTLLGSVAVSTERTWVGRRSLLVSAGGEFTDRWKVEGSGMPNGGFLHESHWVVDRSCCECGVRR